MKKFLKLITVASVIAMLCLTLCSCDMIDDLRSCHAIWDEYPNSFVLNGKKYEYIGNAKELSMVEHSYGIYITNEGIPVLLIEDMGQSAIYNSDHELARVNSNSDLYATDKSRSYIEALLNDINGGKGLSNYGAYSYKREKDEHLNVEFNVVPKAVKSVLDQLVLAIEAGDNVIVPEDDMLSELRYCGDVYSSDDMGIFIDAYKSYTFYSYENKYYFANETGSFVEVSSDYTPLIKSFLQELNQNGYGEYSFEAYPEYEYYETV